MSYCIQIDVLGIWRFISIPYKDATIERFIEQLEVEFQDIYKVATPFKIADLRKGDQVLPREELVENVLSADDIAYVLPSPDWKEIVCTQSHKIVGLEKEDFEERVRLLRQLFGETAKLPVLRSCLLRASGDVSVAAGVCSYITPEAMGIQQKVCFSRLVQVPDTTLDMPSVGHTLY
ncbi:hypothetical protein J8273_8965 [Carpediemonas membranifera]|uniref:Uncharacterized protein n=1 Tax=Carpediemonas membranifera TaxID=201153 RepID=A0A8J6E6K7_9EUKA|nr:hypothetical protein J8273_8965 [Carpediemonas membranifera]|eukprot:KAG9389665.1 hypothetical protein J8273_8965 [Carpediemonas membranifera]